MDTTSTSASSSSAGNIEDIIRLIAPSDRPGFHAMLEHEQRGRSLPDHELRRVAGPNSASTDGREANARTLLPPPAFREGSHGGLSRCSIAMRRGAILVMLEG